MAKRITIGVTFTVEERDAIRAAAKADDRSISALIRKVFLEWLRREEEKRIQDAG